MLGGAIGAGVTGLFARPRRATTSSSPKAAAASYSSGPTSQPPTQVKVKASLLSILGVGLGYAAGMFVPNTSTEERLFAEPKAVLSEKLDDFLQANTRGMKMAAVNAFGVSRLSAAALVGLAVLAELLGPPRRSKAGPL